MASTPGVDPGPGWVADPTTKTYSGVIFQLNKIYSVSVMNCIHRYTYQLPIPSTIFIHSFFCCFHEPCYHKVITIHFWFPLFPCCAPVRHILSPNPKKLNYGHWDRPQMVMLAWRPPMLLTQRINFGPVNGIRLTDRWCLPPPLDHYGDTLGRH